MQRLTLHVPLRFNGGGPIPHETICAIEGMLLDAFGGFTATIARGGWRGETGRTYVENLSLYAVDTDREDADEAMAMIAEWAREACEQEAVYVTKQAVETALYFGSEVPA